MTAASDTIRAAITEAFDGRLIGDFVVVAAIYGAEDSGSIAIHVSDGTPLHSQLGLLTSALNRANAIDIEGWGCGCDD